MVNNSININKTNNHVSPQLIDHKKTTAYDIGNTVLGLGQAHKCGIVIPVNGISIYVFDDNFLTKLTPTRMVHKTQVTKLKPLEINHAYSNSLFKKETKTNH